MCVCVSQHEKGGSGNIRIWNLFGYGVQEKSVFCLRAMKYFVF